MLQEEIFSIESYTFGISGLDTQVMTHVLPGQGVVMAPMDPWFIFPPVSLPSLSTEWVRQFNLVPSQLRWFYWLPFDPPYDIFEWFPKWDPAIKKYKPLTSTGYPIKLPARNIPQWVFKTQDRFKQNYKEELESAYWPPVLKDSVK